MAHLRFTLSYMQRNVKTGKVATVKNQYRVAWD